MSTVRSLTLAIVGERELRARREQEPASTRNARKEISTCPLD